MALGSLHASIGSCTAAGTCHLQLIRNCQGLGGGLWHEEQPDSLSGQEGCVCEGCSLGLQFPSGG